MIPAIFAFFLGVGLALYTTPLMRQAALKFGIVDRPDGSLKNHAAPIPYLGGLAVFLAFLVTLGITYTFSHTVLGILLAGTLMLLVGLIDDLGVLSPWEKLAGQCVAVGVLLKADIFVKLGFIPVPVAYVISVLWLLAITNAFNIIDIMDGLASGVAAIAALFLAGVAIMNQEPMVAVMSSALAGSLVGFLRYNFAPARIYLGDSGSLFIGLLLAALAMNGGYTKSNWLAMLTPVILLGVPLFDLAFVSVLRIERGLSPLRGSSDHFALRLNRSGLSVKQTVGIAYGAGTILGFVGYALMQAPNEARAALIVMALSTVLLGTAGLLRRTGL